MAAIKARMLLDGRPWVTEVALPEGRPTPEAIKGLKVASMNAVNAYMEEDKGTNGAAALEPEPNVMEEGDDIEVEDDDIQKLAAEGAAMSAKKRKIGKR